MTENTKQEGSKWTDAEKVQFLMETIAQMQAAGASAPNFSLFSFPNRTPKALRHLWTKVNKDNTAYAAQLAESKAKGSKPATPSSKRAPATPGSGKRTAQAAFKDGDDGDESPSSTRKRQRAANSKSRARGKSSLESVSVPAPADDDDDDDDDEGEQMKDDNGGVKPEMQFDAGFLFNADKI
ncbi:hypothetical protein F4678DRAFT_467848 [Xylaria arbuscula]|nr:hypothetical protein F4678DRAFT_467848 [Xylaria arbuscula]